MCTIVTLLAIENYEIYPKLCNRARLHCRIMAIEISVLYHVIANSHVNRNNSGLWQMFRTFVLRCDWSILRILKSTKKHERQSERVTLVSIYNNIFRLYHN